MSALKSVTLAITVATDRRDHALELLAQARRAREFGQDQMIQLESYAQDTSRRWAVLAQSGAGCELVQHNHHFMVRLHHAMGLQGDALAALDAELEAARQNLLALECRLASLQQVLARKREVARALRARSEQKEMDEFAAMQYARALRSDRHGGVA